MKATAQQLSWTAPPETAMSDKELRCYRWTTDTPGTEVGYDETHPSPEEQFVRFVRAYFVPHKPRSREGMVWCVFCQKPTHFRGGLAEHNSGKVRPVGWICCKRQLDTTLSDGRREFARLRSRAISLFQYDQLNVLLPEVLKELEEARQFSSLTSIDEKRREFERKLAGLWQWLQGAAHAEGWVEFEEKEADYSRTVFGREDGGEAGSGLSGQRTVRRMKKSRIVGWEFCDPRTNADGLLTEAVGIVKECIEFYSAAETDDIEDRAFGHHRKRVKRVVELLERLERLAAAVPVFFARQNRELVVSLRNRELSRPAYSTNPDGFVWRPPHADSAYIGPPAAYKPLKVRSLSRLRRIVE